MFGTGVCFHHTHFNHTRSRGSEEGGVGRAGQLVTQSWILPTLYVWQAVCGWWLILTLTLNESSTKFCAACPSLAAGTFLPRLRSLSLFGLLPLTCGGGDRDALDTSPPMHSSLSLTSTQASLAVGTCLPPTLARPHTRQPPPFPDPYPPCDAGPEFELYAPDRGRPGDAQVTERQSASRKPHAGQAAETPRGP